METIANEQLSVSKQMLARFGGVGAKAALGKATAASTLDAADFSKQIYDRFAKIMDGLEASVSKVRKNQDNFSKTMIPNKEDMRNFTETFPQTIPFDAAGGKRAIDEQTAELPNDSPLKLTLEGINATLGVFDLALKGVIETAKAAIPAHDFIRTEDGDISFFEKDTIIAGTGFNDIAKMIKGDISPTSNRMETSPLQSIGASTKDLENMTKNSVTNGSSSENKVVIEVRVSTSNDNINPDLNQKIVDVVTQAFKDDMGLKQVVATSIKDVVTNGSRPS